MNWGGKYQTWNELKDYIENATSNTIYLNGSTFNATSGCTAINITKNITINGGCKNGDNLIATIDGKGLINLITTTANITIINVNFINGFYNSTNNVLASGIYSNGTALTLINCSFINNKIDTKTKSSHIGVVYLENGNLTIINTTFKNNIATSGGAIYIKTGNIAITNSIIQNNTANYHNDACGGAIYLKTGNIAITNSIINNNVAKKSNGGAIYLENGNLNITNTTFNYNTAQKEGGVIYLQKGNITINNTTFNQNKAQNHGGAIYLKTGTLTISNSNLNNNVANYNNIGGGGAIYIENGNLTLINNTLNKNTAKKEGGVIYLKTGNIIIVNTNLNNNTASSGGVIYLKTGTLTISNSTLNNNTGKNYESGAIYLENGNLCLTNSNLNNNIAECEGGAVYLKKGNLTITNTNLNNNSAKKYEGGAIYLENGNLNMANSTLNNNVAKNYEGGAVYLKNGDINITNSNFDYNIATNGGAIYLKNGNLTLLNSNFEDNFANDGSSVMATNSGMEIQNSSFINNIGEVKNQIFIGKNSNLSLNNNYFINTSVPIHISDDTVITSPTFIIGDISGKYGTELSLNFSFVDDNNNIIGIDNLPININNKLLNLVFNEEELFYTATYNADYKNITNVTNNRLLNITSKINVHIWNNVTNLTLKQEIVNNEVLVTATLNTDGKLHFYLNDRIMTITRTNNNVASIKISDLSLGEFTVKAIFEGDDVYSPANASVSFTINKLNSKLELSCSINENNAIINVKLNTDGNVSFYLNDEKIGTASTTNNVATITINDLVPGEYSINAVFEGDNKYLPITANDCFTINKFDSKIEITHTIDKHTAIIQATTNTDGNVDFYINNEKVGTVSTTNNVANFTFIYLEHGNHIITTTFENSNYKPTNASIEIEVIKLNPSLELVYSVNVNNVTIEALLDVNGDDEFYVDGDIDFYVDGLYHSTVKTENHVAILELSKLKPGKHDIRAVFNGDAHHNNVENSTSFNIERNAIISVNPILSDDDKPVLNISVRDDDNEGLANFNVTINVNGVLYNLTTDENGDALLNIDLQTGKYDITVYNNITGQNISSTINLMPSIVSNDLKKYYKNDSQFYATILDGMNKTAGAGLKVVLKINGVSYEKITDENGVVKLDINLSPGVYVITISYGNITQTNKVTVLSLINSVNIEMSNKNRKPYVATILNNEGIASEGITVTFNIHGVFYTKTTNKDGIVSLDLDLMEGTYIITAILDNGLMQSNTITIKD